MNNYRHSTESVDISRKTSELAPIVGNPADFLEFDALEEKRSSFRGSLPDLPQNLSLCSSPAVRVALRAPEPALPFLLRGGKAVGRRRLRIAELAADDHGLGSKQGIQTLRCMM